MMQRNFKTLEMIGAQDYKPNIAIVGAGTRPAYIVPYSLLKNLKK